MKVLLSLFIKFESYLSQILYLLFKITLCKTCSSNFILTNILIFSITFIFFRILIFIRTFCHGKLFFPISFRLWLRSFIQIVSVRWFLFFEFLFHSILPIFSRISIFLLSSHWLFISPFGRDRQTTFTFHIFSESLTSIFISIF